MKFNYCLLGSCIVAINLCGHHASSLEQSALEQSAQEQSAVDIRTIDHLYGVVLAGGCGERLWPLSCAAMPKQLLAVGSEKSLLEQAIARLAHIMPNEHVFVSTTSAYEEPINNAVGALIGGILVEPGARNTGPALLLSCLRIYEKDPKAIIIFVPADPFIPACDNTAFVTCLKAMVDHSTRYPVISLCGVKPTYPATGYGYIAYSQGDEAALPVCAFKEKPSLALAQKYVDSGMMLWNTGIFCASARTFLTECALHAPELFMQVSAVQNATKKYGDVESISIDYAVLEKSKNIAVVPATFSWCDVGNVAVFLSLQQTNTTSSVVTIDAHNNLVSAPNKTVALIGVNDLCVIETENALLICKQSEAEKVRNVVQHLKKNGMTKNI